jgi:C4-dicarboxylate-specific signal transduction histidine kinase
MIKPMVPDDALESPPDKWFQIQWNVMLGQLSPYLAHEINQPLTSIFNFSDGLLLGVADASLAQAELVETVKLINVEAARASDLVKRLRVFSRGSLYRYCATNVNEVLRRSLSFAAGFLTSGQVRTLCKFDETIALVSADGARLEQVFLSLIKNAVEAMDDLPSNHRQLEIMTTVEDGFIRIAFRDRGANAAADLSVTQPRPFMTTKPDAIGIGLWISNAIVNHHGGDLRFHEHAPEGLEAVVRLPLESASPR